MIELAHKQAHRVSELKTPGVGCWYEKQTRTTESINNEQVIATEKVSNKSSVITIKRASKNGVQPKQVPKTKN